MNLIVSIKVADCIHTLEHGTDRTMSFELEARHLFMREALETVLALGT